MKLFKHKFATIALIALTIFAAQIGTAMSAFAADAPTDLSITVAELSNWNTFSYRVCNNGPTEVVAFTVETTFTNFTPTKYQNVIFADTNASTTSIDPDTGDWTGTMAAPTVDDPGQCVEIYVLGTVTGTIGQNFDMTATITSATLSDLSANVDTNPGDETATTSPATIVEQADLGMDTRLLTTNTITPGDTVSFELTVKNTGAGVYDAGTAVQFGQPQIYFLMPAGASFVDLLDSNTGDILDVSGCFPVGNIEDQLPSSGYTGAIEGCQLNINSGTTLPSGSSYKFELQVLAGSTFTSGVTEVFGISIGNDEDSILYFARLSLGLDFLATPIDNIFHLTFDDTALIPTINPCSGQGAVVTSNTACFTISFNKTIYGPSFTQDALVLEGTGTITSFTQNGPNLWTVTIGNMELGKTAKLSIAPQAIQDLSAIIYDGTQVLGINTVRYGDATSAGGTLAETGADPDWTTPFMVLFLGICLLGFSKTRKVVRL